METILSTLPKHLPLDFLKGITEQLSEERIVGTGSFGTVYRGTMPDGQTIAVKKLTENAPLADDDREFTNGVQYIMSLQNDNIVKLVGYCREGRKELVLHNGRYVTADVIESLLCYEFLEMGSLQKNLFGIGFSKETLYKETLLDKPYDVGPWGYMAPEFVYRGEISTQSDIYSLGVLILETTTGEKNQTKHDDPTARQFIEKVHKNWIDGHIKSMYPRINPNDLLEVKVCIQIGLQCVQIERKKRPSIENLVDRLAGLCPNTIENQFDQGEASSSTLTKNFFLDIEPMAMTFQELYRMTDGFSESRLLGTGTYGKVYKGILENGEVIAVKKLKSNPTLVGERFKNELLNLLRIRHQNIIRLVGYCSETRDSVVKHEGDIVLAGEEVKALCLEYMQGGNLDEHLSDESSGLDWEARYKIIKGICHGLKHLHTGFKDPIYHLDLKPANILLDKDRIPKIGDFGLSRILDSAQTFQTKTFSGTLGYMPPEYTHGRKISSKFDVFSLGVIILEIVAGPEGYYNYKCLMSPQEFIDNVTGNWSKRVQAKTMSTEALLEVQKCIKIAFRCVEDNHVKRPTITEIVNELMPEMIDLHTVLDVWMHQVPSLGDT